MAGCAGGMLDIGRSMALVPPQLEQPMADAFAPAPEQVDSYILGANILRATIM